MLHIVLFEPEIPQNTANIMRTCIAVDAKLHIIKPCGFIIDFDHATFKRGSANWSHECNKQVYEDFAHFVKENNNPNIAIITKTGNQLYTEINTQNEEIFIMFGKESTGVTKDILANYPGYRIPQTLQMRSLNLANCVAIVAYDILKRLNFPNMT